LVTARHFPPPWAVEDIGGCFVVKASNWAAADGLPVEKRGVFLGRLVAQLQLRGSSFTTTDLEASCAWRSAALSSNRRPKLAEYGLPPDCEIVEVHQWIEFAPAIRADGT
jgi:hypothetical protein